MGVGFRRSQRASVLEATNTEQIVALIVVVPDDTLVVEVHVPAVGAVSNVLRGTPPEAVVTDTEETAIGIAEAARQSGKVIGVLAQVGFARAGRAAISPTLFCLQMLASC